MCAAVRISSLTRALSAVFICAAFELSQQLALVSWLLALVSWLLAGVSGRGATRDSEHVVITVSSLN